MRKTKELLTSADNHRLEAIKHIKAMCPGIDQAETEKFIAAVRRKGRAKVIDIEKIRARGRAKLGLAAAR